MKYLIAIVIYVFFVYFFPVGLMSFLPWENWFNESLGDWEEETRLMYFLYCGMLTVLVINLTVRR